ncbi:MAG: heme-binding domain-containing protein [Sphingobacteriaceae bacterium]|jgi:Haem-binding domain|nr:heme-binding domain-containing protein [Sphingobacteriaceae bacterium]
MKKKFTLKNIGLALLVVFIVMQAFRIEKSNPNTDPANDFIIINQPSVEVVTILKGACYDCHSNNVTYPWYTNIAPFSWWIKDHVNDGRDELNFSEWKTYSLRRMDKKMKEAVEMVDEDEMPMYSYTIMHKNATLTKEQKALLLAFFSSLRTGESDKAKE